MDPRERLRMALLGAGCTRCGRPYPVEAIRVLAQREEIAFVQLECSACDTQTLALVTGTPGGDDASGPAADSHVGGRPHGDTPVRPRSEAAPISDLDVDEMRSFLSAYRGDLRGLLERSDDGPSRT